MILHVHLASNQKILWWGILRLCGLKMTSSSQVLCPQDGRGAPATKFLRVRMHALRRFNEVPVICLGSCTPMLFIFATYPRRQQHAISHCYSLRTHTLLQRNELKLIFFAKCNDEISTLLTHWLVKQYEYTR